MKSEVVFGLEHASWPALLVDRAGVICLANQAAAKTFGPPLERPSAGLSAIWSPENPVTAEQFLVQWERSPVTNVVLKFRGRAGNTLSQPVALCSFLRDEHKFFILQWFPELGGMSEDTKVYTLDATPAHKQKLDCALQLARTVALDFNNALTGILGHTSFVLSRLEADHPCRSSLLEVERAAAKAAEVANDLAAFSLQEKETRPQPGGNLNLLLQRTIDGFRQHPGAAAIEWKLGFERELFTAKFDEARLQQAFARLLENALEALPQRGQIGVQIRNLELAEASQDRNVQLAAGAYVMVEITDSGGGIPAEVLPRVFEPFFTTKRGTHRGLGLAWVYGVVTNLGGGVAISSQVGVGTSVRVYLPAEKRFVQDTGLTADDLRGQETVLMVDDEDLVLNLGQAILSAYGYQVMLANGGQKALELLSGNQPVDLVITDLVMPVMSGRELIEHIHRVAPHVRILCTSGYIRPAGQGNELAYLQKPFTARDLLLKVKQVMTPAPN